MSHQHTTRQQQQRLTDTLLIQTGAADVPGALECSNRPGGGLVLTGDQLMLDTAANLLDQHDYARPILVDRAQYTGTRRKHAKDPFDRNWIRRQQDLPLAATLTDSGYVGASDVDGLHTILTSVAQWNNHSDQPVVAVLPLHRGWLDASKGLGDLIREVTAAGVPIAVTFEAAGDPLGARWAVNGLIQLLAVPVPIIVLRCDISALGALAYGATAAAVGTRTALRHFYPTNPNQGPPPPPQTAAVVKLCLAYYTLDKIVRMILTDPDNPWWRCDCDHCGGSRLDRLRASHDRDTAAFLHSLHTLYQVRADIIGRTTTQRQRQQSWASQCSHALAVHDTIRETLPEWTRPPALKPWADAFTHAGVPRSNPGSGSPGRPVPPPPG